MARSKLAQQYEYMFAQAAVVSAAREVLKVRHHKASEWCDINEALSDLAIAVGNLDAIEKLQELEDSNA